MMFGLPSVVLSGRHPAFATYEGIRAKNLIYQRGVLFSGTFELFPPPFRPYPQLDSDGAQYMLGEHQARNKLSIRECGRSLCGVV